jgi:hypothetical protein
VAYPRFTFLRVVPGISGGLEQYPALNSSFPHILALENVHISFICKSKCVVRRGQGSLQVSTGEKLFQQFQNKCALKGLWCEPSEMTVKSGHCQT